ncbi:xanthine dehydrogenase accessory protein XdhC [Paenochrobactrum sp. BZR 588]|uniref:xanthine dehydrogenase accessory protein XdhC n=1 Tax=unclassified Paenochrobactrum TaxID=2639760 RepID=UPI0038545F78
MSALKDDIRAFLQPRAQVMLVEVTNVAGSAPRDAGTWMLVAMDAIFGTIGGGQLEYMAIDQARKILLGALNNPDLADIQDIPGMDVPLGPEIGQCCGGRVGLKLQRMDPHLAASLIASVDAEIAMRPQVYVFGAGHVGDALATALALLPLRVVLVDTREQELTNTQATGIETCLTALPEQVVRSAPAGSSFIILTHDHALDFLIVSEALARQDTAYVGMIGSKSKRATFRSWYLKETEHKQHARDNFARLICPVGGVAVKDKRPSVIAALVAAEVLTAALNYQPVIDDLVSFSEFR